MQLIYICQFFKVCENYHLLAVCDIVDITVVAVPFSVCLSLCLCLICLCFSLSVLSVYVCLFVWVLECVGVCVDSVSLTSLLPVR